MKISGNDVRVGFVIKFNEKLWVVTKIQHTQPGKGGAYMQVEMKGLLDGTKANNRYRSSESLEKVFLDDVIYQYLYKDGDSYIFMDPTNFEQMQFDADFIGESTKYLKDGMEVHVSFYEGDPISIRLPDTIVMAITEAEPVVKGQTASSSYKPAILENGERIMVPPHIAQGMRVVVNTTDGTYLERAKD